MDRRYLCIYLPLWSVNLARKSLGSGGSRGDPRRPENPPGDGAAYASERDASKGMLLVTERASQTIVARCCPAAKKAGVKEGSSLSLARAFLPEATILRFDPSKELSALQELAVWALRFTPVAGVDTDLLLSYRLKRIPDPRYNGLVLDITGTERLHKGEEKLSHTLFQKFTKARIDAKIAIAPTIGAAWALSRFREAKLVIVHGGDLREALSELPIECLRLDPALAASLHGVGIYFVSELLALPRKSLPVRFGMELLRRVDFALGALHETLTVAQAPLAFGLKKSFDVPITKHESLLKVTLLLLEKLAEKLGSRGKTASLFVILLQGRADDGAPFTVTKEFSLHSATRSPSHLRSLLGPLLESCRMPGGVELVAVSARQAEGVLPGQRDFIENDEIKISSEELLNTFVMRLGRSGVNRVELHPSYLPERSYSYAPIGKDPSGKEGAPRPPAFHLLDDRPSYLFGAPEEAQAVSLLPDKPPSRLRWRGKELRILKGAGPERIGIEWWHSPLHGDPDDRDYFKVQDDTGRWLWVFRTRSSQKWFVQGVWA